MTGKPLAVVKITLPELLDLASARIANAIPSIGTMGVLHYTIAMDAAGIVIIARRPAQAARP